MSLTFTDYQTRAKEMLAVESDLNTKVYYLTLGLLGEAGEIAEKIKKIIRNHNGDLAQLDRNDIKRELGDVQWYLAVLAETLDISLNDIAQTNLDKLADRKDRNVIKSTGDYR